jgi:hypothetical protein
MKIKILPILVIVSLFFTAINVIAINSEDDNIIKIAEKNHHISFSQSTIETKGEYVSVNIDATNTLLRDTGKPMLPAYTKTFTFPRGTKIKNVECILSDITSEVIDRKIQPSPRPIARISLKNTVNQNDINDENNNEEEVIEDKEYFIEDQSVYSSSDLFPDKWYDYKIGCGLYKGEDVIFLKVNCYPVRYSPAENTLYYIDTVDIQITYEEVLNPVASDSEYDMLIIAPKRFSLSLLPLLRHKNKMGVSTLLTTTESIYEEYGGRDKPEQIKYYIKYAKDTYNITYVLLVGGLKSYIYANDRDDRNQGSTAWHLPVRYANIPMWGGGNVEHGYPSDLYYADIYKYNESSGQNEFEDWDNNGNEIFAEDGEELDMYPDVYYGRLACRNTREVRVMVKKIINYEKPSIISKIIGKPWLKRMITMGAITFEWYEGQPDGEWLCNLSIDYMGDLIDDPVRVFGSNKITGGPFPSPKDIIKEFSKGAGFVLFQGHGAPWIWDTHWPNTQGNWTMGLYNYLIFMLHNGRKLPIVVVGGCHNALFYVTLLRTINDIGGSNYWTYGMPASECFSWKLCVKPSGGAIACTGCTGLGLGYPGQPLSLNAELESNFFYEIGQNNAKTLGEAHSGSIIKYIGDYPEEYKGDAYAITEYQLFGDPSLKIGGY